MVSKTMKIAHTMKREVEKKNAWADDMCETSPVTKPAAVGLLLIDGTPNSRVTARRLEFSHLPEMERGIFDIAFFTCNLSIVPA